MDSFHFFFSSFLFTFLYMHFIFPLLAGRKPQPKLGQIHPGFPEAFTQQNCPQGAIDLAEVQSSEKAQTPSFTPIP